MPWKTDTADFADAVAEFEEKLPGFWWSVGQCSVGAHASCGVDGDGDQKHLLDLVPVDAQGRVLDRGHPYDHGIHIDTKGGSPAEALRHIMHEAIKFMEQSE